MPTKNNGLLVYSVLALFVATACSQTMRLRNSRDFPAAVGEAEFSKSDNNNTRVKLEVEHLAPPQNLSPARTTYVVWAQSPTGQVQNLGQIKVGSDRKAEFTGSTAFPVFRLMVTGEDRPDVTFPSPQIVFSTDSYEARR